MCSSCKILHFYDSFRTPLQFFHEIDKVRSLVAQGDMLVENATLPLGEVTGSSKGLLRFELKCTCCGQRLVLWSENGIGGNSKPL